MNQPFDCDYFIRKFEAIPEDKWCVFALDNGDGARCALGHCVPDIFTVWIKNATNVTEMNPTFAEARALWFLFCATFDAMRCNVVHINNGHDPRYQQPHPKQRILQALIDIKSKQEQAAEAFELRPLNLTKPERKETIESIA